jgi:hypothetical protein
MKIALKEHETGEPVFIDTDFIAVIRQLCESPSICGGKVHKRRTRIDTKDGDMFLVQEDASFIASLAGFGSTTLIERLVSQ